MRISSEAKFVRIAPDKLRLVGRQIKGMKFEQALAVLQFNQKAASKAVSLLLKQALAQAGDVREL